MSGKVGTEKISVTLPKQLASEIRSLTSRGEVSALFTHALEHYLAFRKQTISLEKGFGAWDNNHHPGLNIPEDSTAYVRTLREADQERLTGLGGIGAK